MEGILKYWYYEDTLRKGLNYTLYSIHTLSVHFSYCFITKQLNKSYLTEDGAGLQLVL